MDKEQIASFKVEGMCWKPSPDLDSVCLLDDGHDGSCGWRKSMDKEEIDRFLIEEWPEKRFLHADGFEEAFVGVVYGKGKRPVTCYDRRLCIEILMNRDGMTEEEAEEYFSFNVDDTWMGARTPMFLCVPKGLS